MRKLLALTLAIGILCLLTTSVAFATNLTRIQGVNLIPPANDPTTNVPFPTAGDAYCSATNGCGTIPSGGQTANQWTTGDYVISSVFSIPTTSVTDLTASWTYQNFLNGGTETWFVYVNGIPVGQAILSSCGACGLDFNVSGTVNFPGIAPVGGGYQVELILQNTVPPGGGSVSWLDGGVTGLSYSSVPEPSSMMLLGSGFLAAAGLLRRKLR